MTRNLLPAVSFAFLCGVFATPAGAEGFLSVKSEKANLRASPGKGEIVSDAWRHSPLEMKEQKGAWFHVKSFDGTEGWVHGDALGDEPTVIVASAQANIRTKPGGKGKVVWRVERGYPMRLVDQKGNWLRVDDGEGAKGWLHKSVTWGGGGAPKKKAAAKKARVKKAEAPAETEESPDEAAAEAEPKEGADAAAEGGDEGKAGSDEGAGSGEEASGEAAADGGGGETAPAGEESADNSIQEGPEEPAAAEQPAAKPAGKPRLKKRN